ncbi:hypothetical protein [Vreelandella venusta]|uniref:hypothetical protein n=1 Tax=Vreelandella venusta TaxID=44935 RepID=UPI003F66C484
MSEGLKVKFFDEKYNFLIPFECLSVELSAFQKNYNSVKSNVALHSRHSSGSGGNVISAKLMSSMREDSYESFVLCMCVSDFHNRF